MIAIPVEDSKTRDQTIALAKGHPSLNRRRESLKRMLQDLEEEVLGRLRALRTSPAESEPVKDVEEEASEDVTRDLELLLVERGFETLRLIDDALARLDEGLYGICAHCHLPLPAERLRALPVATFCQECQRREEAKAPSPSPRL